jgi:ssRNA-specific RNase YbeY (16S rRNA maturation enzyme)
MIKVHNLTKSQIDEDFFREIARNVLKKEKGEEKTGLSIILVKPQQIRELNKKYKKENRITDVLSFGRELNFMPGSSIQILKKN